MTPPDADDLVRRLLAGERHALARVLTLVEAGLPAGRRALTLLYPRTGRAHTAGITGGSGSGKSTLAAALAKELRRRGRTVGIVAVDPSSPFTRGALLGDRIRMQELTRDPEVFVRSMATRGELGGLAPATAEAVAVLDAAGKDVVLIETVGAGQDEVEVASAADTTVVVLTPGGGDEVQAMKAGIMEVANVLVVNKADLAGADVLLAQLRGMVNQAGRGRRETPVIATIATKGEGVAELADALEEHRRGLAESGELERQRAGRARRQLLALVREHLLDGLLRDGARAARLEELAGAVARRELDPYAAARWLIERT
ncbi:MAG: methylmalonyl Co-A mutase-associated GTPase MeaB [Chloroflexi bacterium]|nr:methylmalonyl Co-A mutase-associated GTPase MeaB [Chloroflexota bacterium]